MKRVILHVGLQKTGSTLLQRNLNGLRADLRAVGVGYHRLRPLNESLEAGHLPALTSTLRATAMPNRMAPPVEQVRSELQWLHDRHAETVILTDENVLGPINLESGRPAYRNAASIMRWLISTVDTGDVTVMLYVRRQDTYLESTYLHRIHVGKTLPFDDYIARVDLDSLDWAELAAAIANETGSDRLRVIPYESIRGGELAYVNRFLQVAGIELQITEDQLAPVLSNRSYSAVALELALRCNDLLSGEDLRMFRTFLQEHFSNATHARPQLLSDEQRSELLDRYAASNKELFATHVDPTDAIYSYA